MRLEICSRAGCSPHTAEKYHCWLSLGNPLLSPEFVQPLSTFSFSSCNPQFLRWASVGQESVRIGAADIVEDFPVIVTEECKLLDKFYKQ